MSGAAAPEPVKVVGTERVLLDEYGGLWPATRIQAEMVAGTFGGPLERLGLR